MNPQDSVLIALVRSPDDWTVALKRNWYRMPVKRGPSEITAKWIAFYMPGSFGDDRWSVSYYAGISDVHVVRRIDLLPDETEHPNAQDPYYAISFAPPIRLARPLRSDRPRRFVWTVATWWRLTAARTLDEVFDSEPVPAPDRDRVLVGVVPRVADFEIARDQGWYRIPQNMVRQWSDPGHVALYYGSAFGPEAGQIHYYAEAWHADVLRRIEMFPDEPRHPRAEENYIRVHLGELRKRSAPICSRRRRRLVLLPTTWERFARATDLNELVASDPEEEAFYGRMGEEGLQPERAYHVRGANAYHLTDYALFCRRRNLQVDVEGSAVSRNAFLQARPKGDAKPPASWESIRLSRFDITRRSEDTVRRLCEEVDKRGGILVE